ncbi:MAG: helix-turn-helix domain-containing protein [Clostridiaceae bacterium]
MKTEIFNAYTKSVILKHALKGNNVSKTCELFGISRATFYHWKNAFDQYGMAGLERKEPQKPQMPNQVNQKVEQEILEYVVNNPSDGPKRIYYELKTEGSTVGESGIYNVLKRHNLSKKIKRIEFAKTKVKSMIRDKKLVKKVPHFKNFRNEHPGYLMIQRLEYMGTFDGIGKIYQYTIYDMASNWGLVQLYNRKQDIDVWQFFEHKLLYLIKTFNLKIDHLITDKTKTFVPYFVKDDKYLSILENAEICHYFVSPENNTLFDELNVFSEYLIKGFYRKISGDNSLDTFEKVERSIQKFVRTYNFSSVISSGLFKGKTPAETVLGEATQNQANLDTLPLWLLALIEFQGRGNQNESEK